MAWHVFDNQAGKPGNGLFCVGKFKSNVLKGGVPMTSADVILRATLPHVLHDISRSRKESRELAALPLKKRLVNVADNLWR
jgi:hypothetical protein